MELQVGDAIEYKGKPGKVTKVTDQKCGIQLDDPDDKDQPKGLVNKTNCVKLEKTSVPEGAVTPSRNRSARAGGGAAIGMAIGAMVAGVVGASVGAVLGGALVGAHDYSKYSYKELQQEAKERNGRRRTRTGW